LQRGNTAEEITNIMKKIRINDKKRNKKDAMKEKNTTAGKPTGEVRAASQDLKAVFVPTPEKKGVKKVVKEEVKEKKKGKGSKKQRWASSKKKKKGKGSSANNSSVDEDEDDES
jgi:hypothetical protein